MTTFTQDELQLDIERAEHELLMSFYELRRLLRLLPRGARGRDQIAAMSRAILAIEEPACNQCRPLTAPSGLVL